MGRLLTFTLVAWALALGLTSLVPGSLPGDPRARADKLQALGRREEAAPLYRELWAQRPHDLEALRRVVAGTAPEAIPALRARVAQLAPELRSYLEGLLLLEREGDAQGALQKFAKVKNRHLPYLALTEAQAWEKLGDEARASACYREEIENGGAVAEAIAPLQSCYFRQDDVAGALRLLQDPRCAGLVRPGVEAWVRARQGQGLEYVLANLRRLTTYRPAAVGAALLIAVAWAAFFRRISLVRVWSWPALLGMLSLGCLSSLFLTDPMHSLFLWLDPGAPISHMAQVSERLLETNLRFTLVHVSLVEELVKLLPFFLVAAAVRFQQPLDYLILASLSGLGFATCENFDYFSRSQAGDVLLVRLLGPVLFHMASVSLVAWAWAWARTVRRHPVVPILLALGAAVWLHALSDYFSGPRAELLCLLQAWLFGRLLGHALALSSGFSPALARSPRLLNRQLLWSLALALTLVAYLDRYFTQDLASARAWLGVHAWDLVQVPVVLFTLEWLQAIPGRTRWLAPCPPDPTRVGPGRLSTTRWWVTDPATSLERLPAADLASLAAAHGTRLSGREVAPFGFPEDLRDALEASRRTYLSSPLPVGWRTALRR